MAEKEKIKVVWLCHFSNSFVHERLHFRINPLIRMIRKLFRRSLSLEVPEFANWITNGITECEKINELELHVVSPCRHLKGRTQEFMANGVHYHFFHNEDDDLIPFISRNLFHKKKYEYKKNCRIIKKIINSIHPQVIHLFGAENPHYSLGVLGNYENVITIAQLQTLINDPDFKRNYPIDDETYYHRAAIEKRIIKKADFLGTRATKYRQLIQNDINPDAIILNTTLALEDTIEKNECKKLFDFVYFSANIDKAADLAIEAFGLAHQVKPDITLDVIGSCGDPNFLQILNGIINKYKIKDFVTFEGMLPTHNDVLKRIRQSRFALLPLKIDLTSGTIREAMSNGLPVITTDTGFWGTQKLNLKRQNVLISPIGNHQALADNMLRLLSDASIGETLRQNAYQTRLEAQTNEKTVNKYVEAYKACLENYWNNKPLPKELIMMP